MSDTCDHCGAGGATARCAKCKVIVYCSRECQVAAWKGGHKKLCALVAAAAAAHARAPDGGQWVWERRREPERQMQECWVTGDSLVDAFLTGQVIIYVCL